MEGKFNPKYFIFGNGKEDWIKTLGYGWRLLVILLAVFIIYKAFRPTQHNQITVGQGGIVNVQQNTEKKRSWWVPTPFVDIYTFVETDDRKGFGGRFGARWEW